MRLAAIAIVSLVAVASADAQTHLTTSLGTGFVSPVDNAGLHLQGSVALSTDKRVYPRADFVLENSIHRNLLLVGNLVFGLRTAESGLYAIAGAGTFLDNGPHPLVAGGLGLAMPTAWRAPIAIESRVISNPHAHVLLTLLVRP